MYINNTTMYFWNIIMITQISIIQLRENILLVRSNPVPIHLIYTSTVVVLLLNLESTSSYSSILNSWMIVDF